MVDHDQRFKEILREFVWESVELFLPRLAARLAQRVAQWQTQDVFTNPPLGTVKKIDLLAILAERQGQSVRDRLLHLEVESANSLTEVRQKIGYYYPFLRKQYNLPVTTLAVYLRVGLDGLGWDEYIETGDAEADEASPEEQEEEVYRVRWRYVGLPALPAERYLTGNNWLGVALAALMKIEPERKPWLRAECLRRLATECQENDYRKLLLFNCVETYLPLEGAQQSEFLRLLQQDPRYQETNAMLLSAHDRIRLDARREGEQKALQGVVIRLGSKRCGTPDEAMRTKIQAIEDVERLERLVEAATTAQTWDELLAIA